MANRTPCSPNASRPRPRFLRVALLQICLWLAAACQTTATARPDSGVDGGNPNKTAAEMMVQVMHQVLPAVDSAMSVCRALSSSEGSGVEEILARVASNASAAVPEKYADCVIFKQERLTLKVTLDCAGVGAFAVVGTIDVTATPVLDGRKITSWKLEAVVDVKVEGQPVVGKLSASCSAAPPQGEVGFALTVEAPELGPTQTTAERLLVDLEQRCPNLAGLVRVATGFWSGQMDVQRLVWCLDACPSAGSAFHITGTNPATGGPLDATLSFDGKGTATLTTIEGATYPVALPCASGGAQSVPLFRLPPLP
jgi:hypothetical protein